jgi:hypothetical protein
MVSHASDGFVGGLDREGPVKSRLTLYYCTSDVGMSYLKDNETVRPQGTVCLRDNETESHRY